MNQQYIADLFSEQVDRALRGEPPTSSLFGDKGLQEMLGLANELAGVRFQASPKAQAAFQNQLGGWFGPTHTGGAPRPKHGRWNTMMSGKLLALIISILITITTGLVSIVIVILVVIRGFIPGLPTQTPTPAYTATPPVTETATPLPSTTSTLLPTETLTATPVASPTIASTIDTIEAITVVVTIEIDVRDILPGLPPGDGGHHDDDDDDDDDGHHDHDRGHGNDPDHDDDDNPGRDDD